MSSSSTLHLLPLFLLLPVGSAITFSISNQCSYTVWPAATPVGGGTRLDPGASWTLNMPAGTSGRVWPRTGCLFDSAGNGSCQTGDCAGALQCTVSGKTPATLAEYTLGNPDYLDISLVDGFNVPMDFLPVPANGQKGQGCSKGPRCAANITSQCPSQLKAPGGCNNACTVFNEDKYCCIREGGKTCEPTTYSVFFIRMCPDAYSYSYDDSSSTMFTCPSGTNYQVVFCPPANITSLPPATNASAPRNPATFPRSRVFGVVLGSVGSLIVLLIFITFFAYKLRTRRHREMEEVYEEFGELPGMPTRFTFQQLEEATDQFRDKLGEGGFGSVFEGQYANEKIAVKRLDQAGQGKKEFLAEVQTIGGIHHINLVRLIGFCAEKSHRLLVYEYMPKGSLDKWIYNRHDNDAPPLDWQTRCKIITHIAKGLSYLHEECMKRIAHLDVKPQNILLDENFNAKLSDFGLKKVKSDELAYLIDKHSTDMQVHKQEVLEMMKLAMWCLQIDSKRRPQMSEVIKVLEGHMNAESKIDHNFVATSQTMFGIAENTGSSDPPQASYLSGPR
ncbi:Zeamatin [Dichanthelium oligosanthes]|uniref:non-specific serine/threonine protein kinase n=1 Tax=Dichanthelium oligosanthes TaxID=888268 RepID=A0A1E5VEC2_9POAL|nr:Zeamatin [Dichanthelium oligosanthes]